MPEWWTYAPSDFQLFAARTYFRLVEAHNAAAWPAQLAFTAAGLGVLAALLRRARPAARALAALSAVACVTVAWAFLWRRYAQIHWLAPAMAAAFVLEALLLGALALRGRFDEPAPPARLAAIALLAFALIGMPLLAPLAGAPWTRAEVLGLMPAPTVLAVLALAPLASARARRALLPMALAWCALEALTLWPLEVASWLVLPLGAGVGLAGCVAGRRRVRKGGAAGGLDPGSRQQ